MRFCRVTTFSPPEHFGGDGVFVSQLADLLAGAGHHVEVVHCADSCRLLRDRVNPSPLPILLELCAGTGARRGEVLACRWSDLRDGRLHIARSLAQVGSQLLWKGTKTDKPKVVALGDGTLQALYAHRAKQGELRAQFGPDYRADLDLIVCGPGGEPLRPNSISSAVSQLCKRLKLPKGVSLHTLRHSHASQLISEGMALTAVSARLGHSRVNTTLGTYAHALRAQDDEAAKVWERIQGKAGAGKGLKQ